MPLGPPLTVARARVVVAFIALCALAGLALRLALLVRAGWRYDYDEGMVGLQALSILRGERPVFHPGQPYLAALESYLIAPWFALFGADAMTLKLVPWLISWLYVATTGWLGWRTFDQRVGALSALLAALAPAYLLITGMKAWGATAETLVLGNLALIGASYVVDGRHRLPARARALVLLGFIGGVAFWVSWLIVFYAVPSAAVIVWRGRAALRRAWWAAGLAFALGSAPLWAYNLSHDWATFRYLLRAQGDTWGNLPAVLDHLTYDLAPRLVSGDPRWHILSWEAIWWLQIAYQGSLIGLALWAWRGPWPGARRPTRALLAVFALALPPIYALSGYSSHALNEFGFDATGRYVLMLHSVLPIGAAAMAVWLAGRGAIGRLAGAAMLASVLSLNMLGALRADPLISFASPYYTRQPETLDPLIALLDEEGIRHVWTDVGIAHVLMLETEERILAADWYDIYGARGLLRFPEVPQRIYAAERVAFVEVVLPGQKTTRFEETFRDAGVSYRRVQVTPDLLVIIPDERIDPALVGDGLGYQF
jgi:hypothetical protein